VHTAHIGDQESAIWLGTDFIRDRGEESTVTLLEDRTVGIRGIEIVCRVLLLSTKVCEMNTLQVYT
jgi:hypothetical protein